MKLTMPRKQALSRGLSLLSCSKSCY